MRKNYWTRFDFQAVSGLDESLRRRLKNKYKIQKFDLEDIFTDTQLSKLEHRGDYFFIAMQFPEYDKNSSGFETKELACLLSKDYLIVIDKNEYKDLKSFLTFAKNLVPPDSDSSDVFFELLDFLVTKHIKAVHKFKREVADLEEDLFDFEEHQTDLIKQILVLKRNLINFESLMEPLRDMLLDFQTRYSHGGGHEANEKIDDTLDKLKKILNNLRNLQERMRLVSEANETILARSTNSIIKALTGVNVIVLVPTIITSFFGMNLYFGWDPSIASYAELALVILIAVISTTVTWVYFKRKNWV
jgi:magnesium transporter